MKNRIFILAGLMLIFSACTNASNNGYEEVESARVQQMLAENPGLVVLDVRTPAEYNEGHIAGAINIDMHAPDAVSRINALDKNAAYIVYCRTRNRSGVVVNTMVQNGFKTVYHMTDGMTGWNMNGFPVER